MRRNLYFKRACPNNAKIFKITTDVCLYRQYVNITAAFTGLHRLSTFVYIVYEPSMYAWGVLLTTPPSLMLPAVQTHLMDFDLHIIA